MENPEKSEETENKEKTESKEHAARRHCFSNPQLELNISKYSIKKSDKFLYCFENRKKHQLKTNEHPAYCKIVNRSPTYPPVCLEEVGRYVNK